MSNLTNIKKYVIIYLEGERKRKNTGGDMLVLYMPDRKLFLPLKYLNLIKVFFYYIIYMNIKESIVC